MSTRDLAKNPASAGEYVLVRSHINQPCALESDVFRVAVMVRSVLRVVQGHETHAHADLTDRDRDESSRRAISAWVRTNPQTQV